MTSDRKTKRDYSSGDEPAARFVRPEQLWGRVLTHGRPLHDADLPFVERVKRALAHLEATRFLPEEYERLRGTLVELIEGEQRDGTQRSEKA